MSDVAIVALPEATDPSRFGTKATNLALASRWGHEIAPGLVCTHEVATRIAARCASDVDALMGAARDLGMTSLAIRSSAIGEDSLGASFAGMFVSVIGVPLVRDAVCEAFRQCVESVSSRRVELYANAMRVPVPLEMPVIVQQALLCEIGTAYSSVGLDGGSAVLIETERGGRSTVRFNDVGVRSSATAAGQDSRIAEVALDLDERSGRRVDLEWAWCNSLVVLQWRYLTHRVLLR